MTPLCELCSSPASLYCHADAAPLCSPCDAHVHSANFLVARHTRSPLPSPQLHPVLDPAQSLPAIDFVCHPPATEFSISRWSYKRPRDTDSEDSDAASLSSSTSFSSECVDRNAKRTGGLTPINESNDLSSTDRVSSFSPVSAQPTGCRQRCQQHTCRSGSELKSLTETRLESILWKWHNDLGLKETGTVSVALHLLQRAFQIVGKNRNMTRISLAICLWVAAKQSERAEALQGLVKQIERCTGVPEKQLQVGELRLCRMLEWELQEEWAESRP